MIRLCLVLSLLGNAALAVWMLRSDRPDPTAAAVRAADERRAEIEAWRSTHGGADPVKGGGPAAAPVNWASLSKLSPQEMADQLRAAGVPDRLIRYLIRAQLNEVYAQRKRELVAGIETEPFWRTMFPTAPIPSPEAQAELRQLSRKNGELIAAMFGPDPTVTVSNAERMQFGNLSPDKIERLKVVLSDYNDITAALGQGTYGAAMPEDRDKMALLLREREADIRALLTPEEYDEYDMRSSTTGGTVRTALALMSPSEEEFRKVYALQKAYDSVYNPFTLMLAVGNVTYGFGPDPRLAPERTEAQKALAENIKAALGPDRGAEYERLADPSYRATAQIMTRLQLPVENATQLWRVQKDIQERATAIQKDTTLDFPARSARLTGLRDEATAKATTLLGGQRGLDTYRTSGGTWIENLVPPPPPTRP